MAMKLTVAESSIFRRQLHRGRQPAGSPGTDPCSLGRPYPVWQFLSPGRLSPEPQIQSAHAVCASQHQAPDVINCRRRQVAINPTDGRPRLCDFDAARWGGEQGLHACKIINKDLDGDL
uniref:Uncharacterized protein n=1 Tax=Oryza barthii TaxID=65489 RepID=A0A0D3HKZ1_9ORYZ